MFKMQRNSFIKMYLNINKYLVLCVDVTVYFMLILFIPIIKGILCQDFSATE